MVRDLRDVVNKIIVAIGDDEATTEEVAELSAQLAAFFDASVVLVYITKTPLAVPPGEGVVSMSNAAAVANIIEENARKTLQKMAATMESEGVQVSSRIIMLDSRTEIKRIIEEEKADLLILPHWKTGATQRLLRVLSPSLIEDATCSVLVLKGNRWLADSKAPRPGKRRQASSGRARVGRSGSVRSSRAPEVLSD
ncbi:MAG: universal stress protein [Nitrososphaerales archaeon]